MVFGKSVVPGRNVAEKAQNIVRGFRPHKYFLFYRDDSPVKHLVTQSGRAFRAIEIDTENGVVSASKTVAETPKAAVVYVETLLSQGFKYEQKTGTTLEKIAQDIKDETPF